MSDFQYLKDSLKHPNVASEIQSAIDMLEKHHVFSFLREVADNHMDQGLAIRPDMSNVVLTAGERNGYSRAISNLQNIIAFVGTAERVASAKNNYGVKQGDVD